ncbi:MAG TPA: hypothetical protein ENJ84_11160 [Gammaproteobacteria bacterium]|nr:hypothetical protein [Gammaproteobacteria bacterium]
MSARIPYYLDPFREAERGRVLEGALMLAKMPRLTALLVNTEGTVTGGLEFYQPFARQYRVDGWVQAALNLECQRCLKPYSQPVKTAFTLALVQSEAEAEVIPEGIEPYVVEDDQLDLSQLFEDELMLALPSIPRHIISTDCDWKPWSPEYDDRDEEVPEKSPFSVLAELNKH